jgi:serine/threonine protein kinase
MQASPCPVAASWQRFLLGKVTPSEAAALDEHLQQCDVCLAVLPAVPADDSMVEALQAGSLCADGAANLGARLHADWLKNRHLGVNSSLPPNRESTLAPLAVDAREPYQHPQGTDKAVDFADAASVDEARANEAGDTTKTYDFLGPAQGPLELGRLGHYQVRKVLGSGGMGVVFQAYDADLQRLVALKTTLPAAAEHPSAKQRFLREARATAAIKHDHIVTIYHVGEDRGVAYLAMEFLEGESLDQRLRRQGRLPWREALRIARETAQGLAAAHKHGLIHRDIKPGNIWLESRSEGRGTRDETRPAAHAVVGPRPSPLPARVKILDFGLVLPTADNANLTQSGAIVGTPAFMAPEQCRGQTVDARADLFSLGCVLYRMVTGEAPFRGTHPISTLIAVATSTPRPPQALDPKLPPAACALIMRLLSKDPADRPPSAAAVIEAIEAIEQGRAQPAAPTWRPRRPAGWAIAAVLACVLGLAGWWTWAGLPPYDSSTAGPAAKPDDDRGDVLADRAVKAVSWSRAEPKGLYADGARALSDVVDFAELVGGTSEELRDWHAKLDAKYRIAVVSSRKGAGPTLFNAVAVETKTPLASRVQIGIDQPTTDRTYWPYEADGWRLIAICANLSADQKDPSWSNTLLWAKCDDKPKTQMNWYGPLPEIIEQINLKKRERYRTIYLSGPVFPEVQRYNTVMCPGHGRAWETQYALTSDELHATIEDCKRKGWRPDVIAPHWVDARLRHMLVVVDNSDQVDWRFRMDMSRADYQKESAQQKRAGLFPLGLVSYGHDAEIRYAAIFVRYRNPGKI